jgi:flagellar biosynthesis/type III secretory pathway protein FliH
VSTIRPLFAPQPAVAARPLADVLDARPGGGAPAPWLPREPGPSPSPDPVPVALDTAQLERDARERGRAEGLAETAALRERLATLVVALESERSRNLGLASAQIADAAVTTVSAWLGSEDRAARLAPAIQRWLGRCAGEQHVTARVHPDDVDAMKAAIGDANIEVVGDPAFRAGDLVIRGGLFELVHRWDERLRELHELIVAALDAEAPTP